MIKKSKKLLPKTDKPELMSNNELFHELTIIDEKMFSNGQAIVKEALIRLFEDFTFRKI